MLAKLGWLEGRNLKIDQRVGMADANRLRTSAAGLVSLAPDVIVAGGAAPTRAVQQATQTIPIVFTGVGDPAANGLVRNIVHPEGNTTGFSTTEPAAAGKWLELLKAAAPRITRVVIVFNPDLATTSPNYIASIEQGARTLSVQTVKAPFRMQALGHACGWVTTGIWVEACAASLISVPPWPSLAAAKVDAM
jgi:putative ABC transport system substrate-binding protein